MVRTHEVAPKPHPAARDKARLAEHLCPRRGGAVLTPPECPRVDSSYRYCRASAGQSSRSCSRTDHQDGPPGRPRGGPPVRALPASLSDLPGGAALGATSGPSRPRTWRLAGPRVCWRRCAGRCGGSPAASGPLLRRRRVSNGPRDPGTGLVDHRWTARPASPCPAPWLASRPRRRYFCRTARREGRASRSALVKGARSEPLSPLRVCADGLLDPGGDIVLPPARRTAPGDGGLGGDHRQGRAGGGQDED